MPDVSPTEAPDFEPNDPASVAPPPAEDGVATVTQAGLVAETQETPAEKRRFSLNPKDDERPWFAVSRWVMVTAVTVVALVLGSFLWVSVEASQTNKALDEIGVSIGKAEAPVTVDIWFDFMCPACAKLDAAAGTDIADAVNAGTARVRMHPMNFLDKSSGGTQYSSRAANAFIVVAKQAPDKALAFQRLLFENQPEESSTGLTQVKIAELATQAGVDASVTAGFDAMEHQALIDNTNTTSINMGIRNAPTVKVNGTRITGPGQAGVVKAAIEAAR